MRTQPLEMLSIIYASVVLSSCGPVLYSNVGQNVPMFTQKGEFAGAISYSAAFGQDLTDAAGVGLNAAYAISDKWAGLMSYYSMKNAENTKDEEWQGQGSYFEVGGGRFGTLENKKFAYEVFGGFGFAGIRNQNVPEKIDVKIFKPFIQPSIGYISRYFDFIVTPRISYINYSSHAYQLNDVEMRANADQFFEQQNNVFVFEPGFTLRGGIKNVKLQMQYNFSSFKNQYGNFYPVNDIYGSIGLYFLISNRYLSKPKP